MKITTSNLVRFSGLALIPAGIVFAGIQPIHPPDVVESVTTGAWAIITSLKFAMCLFFMVGITGLYTRQVEKAGWVGLAGFALLFAAIPVALALAWLGYALWSERRVSASQAVPATGAALLRPAAAK